jgi:hypothetical protein
MAAIARLDGVYPACSSSLNNGSHSTATALVQCFP